MSFEELRIIWTGLLSAGIATSVAAVVAILVGKPYLSSYLETKGKNLATKEDVQHVLDELQKTETLKSEISQRAWLRQQQWATREKHYLGLLESLTKFCISLLDRIDYFLQPGSEENREIGNDPNFRKLQSYGHQALLSAREQVGPAAVFLSEPAIDSINKLIDEHWSVAEFSMCTKDYLSEALGLAQTAYEAVLAEAKRELKHAEGGI